MQEAVASAQKILGPCLGMQMLCEGSEEGELEGLASLPGRFERFYGRDELDRPIKVPHMGWNTVSFDLLKAP